MPPARPCPCPCPRRRRPWSGSSCRTARGEEWVTVVTVGRPACQRPAAGPAGHRPADIKLGPCKRDKGNYWCGMPVQDG